jgi:hypothetical protein
MTDVWRPTVLASARQYITVACREGEVNFMYCDVHDPPLVTTGPGKLIDPLPEALKYRWRYKHGGLDAGPESVAHEWQAVKDAGPLAKQANYGINWWLRRALLELAPGELDRMFTETLEAFGTALAAHYVSLKDRCADEQLGLVGMVWGLGPGRMVSRWVKFNQAYAARDYDGMILQCGINNKYHDSQDKRCFSNAEQVARRQLDPDALYWPRDLAREGGTLA